MGRPIYVHTEEEDSPSKGDRECVHTWRSFARRLERYPFVLGDPEPTLDANTASVDTRFIVLGTAPQTVDNRQLPDPQQAPALIESDNDEWEALAASPYMPLHAGTMRSASARHAASPTAPRSHPVSWTADFSSASTSLDQDPAPQHTEPEWPSLAPQRSRRARRFMPPADAPPPSLPRPWASPPHTPGHADRTSPRRTPGIRPGMQLSSSHCNWMEMWHLMRRELMATSIGRRASGEIPTVREAQDDGRSSTALEMARHAARDLLRQLDVRIAESRANNDYLRSELSAARRVQRQAAPVTDDVAPNNDATT